MVNLVRRINRRLLSSLASVLSLVAVVSVSTASILFVYKGEVPEELLRKEE
ncbi:MULTISPECIES: AgrD family cyclic lactone autoinducer peptide [Paenibacillus]|uniref:Cyclic lactone autoinducer peptide n=1 Tax=Paenibacillus campinasensis TaxID=66347 RepID=A0ABW9SUS8_9BACL|nr:MULTISPECIES: cyclic lactone autoinducer peptide [Paenibacillus]MUG64728.1 cyclic lactone autoinducer peptide [Paenibacillus campinasensis]PAK55444.1 hypothetical protein CHH75_04160 [Paenibacillus sp. 7541]